MRRISMKGKKGNDTENVSTDENEGENNSEVDNSVVSRDGADEDQSSAKNKHSEKSNTKKTRKKSGNSANGKTRQKTDPLEIDSEPEYEVEKVVGKKKVKNVIYYLIRWKGYTEDDDTWEDETTLNCPELIKDYEDAEGSSSSFKKSKGNVKAGKRGQKTAIVKSKRIKRDDSDDQKDDDKEYEVDRIIEVHHLRNGKREFLIRWKGYPLADATWEPEEHLNCKELIDKFMSKLDYAKKSDQRELRQYRTPTKRFTLNTLDTGRRLSRRHKGRQRMSYHDSE